MNCLSNSSNCALHGISRIMFSNGISVSSEQLNEQMQQLLGNGRDYMVRMPVKLPVSHESRKGV
jgi:hypothetical protein